MQCWRALYASPLGLSRAWRARRVGAAGAAGYVRVMDDDLLLPCTSDGARIGAMGKGGRGRGEHSKSLISRRVRHALPPWWCLSDNDGVGPDDEAVPLFS
jgi:hypothetical protein